MKVKDLKPNKRNPRKISDKQLDALKKSVAKFGDLSGFIFNKRTGQLISGHQRSKTIPADATIKKEIKHEEPTSCGTIAEGYVLLGDERFKYREVDWPETMEVEALLAANKHGGSWDNDILKLNFADFPDLDIDVTGFDVPELERIGIDFDVPELSDAAYMAQDSGPQADSKKEIIGESIYTIPPEEQLEPAEVFDKTEEKTDIVGKRYVIIIDCKDDEHKKNIKESIKPLVEEADGKFF